MRSADLALILTGVLLNAVAQLLLKAGSRAIAGCAPQHRQRLDLFERALINLPIIAGLACYAISVMVWILALSRVDVSVAYPMLSVGYVVNAVAAWMLFGEHFDGDAPSRHRRDHRRRAAGRAQLRHRSLRRRESGFSAVYTPVDR